MNLAARPLAFSYVRSQGPRGITIGTGRESPAQPRTLRQAVTLRRHVPAEDFEDGVHLQVGVRVDRRAGARIYWQQEMSDRNPFRMFRIRRSRVLHCLDACLFSPLLDTVPAVWPEANRPVRRGGVKFILR
jgi:hypothetical protein